MSFMIVTWQQVNLKNRSGDVRMNDIKQRLDDLNKSMDIAIASDQESRDAWFDKLNTLTLDVAILQQELARPEELDKVLKLLNELRSTMRVIMAAMEANKE